jgi:hypothetical protein
MSATSALAPRVEARPAVREEVADELHHDAADEQHEADMSFRALMREALRRRACSA